MSRLSVGRTWLMGVLIVGVVAAPLVAIILTLHTTSAHPDIATHGLRG
jgi:hypothetical protein